MIPPKSKDPRVEQVESLFKAINQPYAKLDDVLKLTKQLIDYVRSAKSTLEKSNNESLAQFEERVYNFTRGWDKKLEKAEERAKKTNKQTIDEARKLMNELRIEIGSIETYHKDLSSLDKSVQRLAEQIPESLTAVDIRNLLEALDGNNRLKIEAIDDLREELDELKKRQVKGSGGGNSVLSVGHWPRHESFTMNGSDTTVTLLQGVAANGTAIIVRYQGQTLDMDTHYTVSGTKVTLVGFTPEADTIISVTYWT